MNQLRQAAKVLPTLALAFGLAVAVWISAVTGTDPSETNTYRPIPVEVIGQDPSLVVVAEPALQVSVTINAPQSTWRRLNTEDNLITAVADLSGLGPGTHSVPVQVTPRLRTIEILDKSPQQLNFTLETLSTRTVPIQLVRRGEPAIGFQAEDAALNQDVAVVSGPDSLVAQVRSVRAVLDLADAHENISQTLPLQAVGENEIVIDNVSLNPERVQVTQPITQKGGFRSDLVVRPVYQGVLAAGYRLTSISVFPPAVTVFSADPSKVNNLPGYVETDPINLDGVKDDLEVRVGVRLPEGVSLVGEQSVLVQVGIAAIESSLTLRGQVVEVQGLDPTLAATVTPDVVDIILSGPLPLLDALVPGEVRVFVDLTGLGEGMHQIVPQVQLRSGELAVESILPGTLQVEIAPAPPTPTPTRTPRP